MQITEVSVLGVRSAVVVFRHRATPLRFVMVPMIHIGRPDYYRQVSERIAQCGLIVAEGYDGPSSTGLAYLIALRLTRQRHGPLVHQDIDYTALGVPVIWPEGLFPAGRRKMPWFGWLDVVFLVPYLVVVMAVGGRNWLLRRNLEVSDDTEVRISRWSFLNRAIVDERDDELVAALARIHEERANEPVDVAIVYGAGHFPAVVRALAGRFGYRPLRGGDWLTAIDF